MWCEKWYCTIWAKTTSRLCTVKDIKLVIYSKNWIPENSGLKSEKIDTTLFFLQKWALKKQKKIPNIYFYFISYCYVSSPPGSAIDSSVMILVMIRRSGTRYECTGLLLFRNRSWYIHTLYLIFWSSLISSPTNGRQNPVEKMHFRRYRPNF